MELKIMKIFYRMFIIASLMLIAQNLFIVELFANNDPSDIAAELNDDIYTLFIEKAQFCKVIIDKYSQKKRAYVPQFINILKDKKFDSDTIHNVIFLLALLRENKAQAQIKEIADHRLYELNGVDDFYFLRIRKESDLHLDNLKILYEKLLTKDVINDSKAITYLPFLDDFNVSLNYLNKMSQKSDGAGSELLNWSLDYMIYENTKIRKTLVNSIAYHIFYGAKNN
jgi:hypothetical protein